MVSTERDIAEGLPEEDRPMYGGKGRGTRRVREVSDHRERPRRLKETAPGFLLLTN